MRAEERKPNEGIPFEKYVIYTAIIIFILIMNSKVYQYENHTFNEQIPQAMKLMDNTLFTKDQTLEDFSKPNIRTPYAYFISIIARPYGLKNTLFFLELFFNLTINILLALICYRMTKSHITTIIFMMIIQFEQIVIGNTWVVPPDFAPTTITITLFLLGLYIYIKDEWKIKETYRKLISFTIWTTGFIMHSSIGSIALIPMVIWTAYDYIKNRKGIKELAMILTPLIIFGGTWFLYLNVYMQVTEFNPYVYHTIADYRIADHIKLMDWAPNVLIISSIIHALFIIAIWGRKSRKTKLDNLFYYYIAFSVISYTAYFIIVEALGMSHIGKIVFYRMSTISFPIMFIYIADNLNWYKNYKYIINKNLYIIAVTILLIFLSVPFRFPNEPQENTTMYSYITENTQKDDLFLINPMLREFRINTNRSIVVDYAVMPFSNEGIIRWRKTLEDVAGEEFKGTPLQNRNKLSEKYEEMSEEHMKYIIKKYQVDYVIRTNEVKFLPLVYENEVYKIYGAKEWKH